MDEQVLLGGLLGDGHISLRRKAKNPMYSEEHCLKQTDYARWKNALLGFKETFVTRTDPRRKFEKTYSQICIYSPNLPELHEYYSLFYPERKKVVTPFILSRLSALGLAVWYCDDGSYNYRDSSCYISAMAFSEHERSLIIAYFHSRWNLSSRVVQEKIWFNSIETKKFIALIIGFVPPCMRYKCGESAEHRAYAEAKNQEYNTARRIFLKESGENSRRCKLYRSKNKERMMRNCREYYKANRDKILAQKREKYLKRKLVET